MRGIAGSVGRRAALLVGGCAVVMCGCATTRPAPAAAPGPMLDAPRTHGVGVSSVTFSPDGQLLTAADGNAGTVTVWDVTTPAQPRRAGQVSLNPHPGPHPDPKGAPSSPFEVWVNAVRFAPNSRVLAVAVSQSFPWSPGAVPGSVSFFDLTDPTRPAPLGKITDPIGAGALGIEFSSSRPLLAVRPNDGTTNVTLWDTADPAQPHPLGTLDTRDLTTATPATMTAATAAQTEALSLSPLGDVLAAGWGQGAALWDTRDPANATRLSQVLAPSWITCGLSRTDCKGSDTGSGGPESVQISPDGHILAVGTFDQGRLLLYDITNPARPHAFALPPAGPYYGGPRLNMLAFDPNDRLLASGATDDAKVTLWDLNDPAHTAQIRDLVGVPDSPQTVAFSPNGHLLAVGGIQVVQGGSDSVIELWDVSDPAAPKRLD